jgi:multidrug efflux pump subunit AcrB
MRPFSIIIIFAALVLIGLAFIPGLGVQLHPSATLPSLSISFNWHEAPAVNIEREVTSKLEGALATLRDVEEISSVSRRGNGRININFKKGADLEMARFEISSRIRRLYPDFPMGVSYPNVSVSRAVGNDASLLMYTVAAPGSSNDIVSYLENYVLPELSKIRGVDKVNWHGANPHEFRLVYDTRKMKVLGITSAQINHALRDYFVDDFIGMGNVPEDAGTVAAAIPVMLQGRKSADPAWENMPLANIGGQIIYLTDVVKVIFTEREAQNYYRINGKNTLILSVDAEKGENQIRLANTIRTRMDELQKQMPANWQVILTWDDTDFIRKDLQRVGYRMLFSFIILMLFVLLVSRNVRYLLLILVTVVTNLLLAVIWYHFFGIEIHLYSLAGITVSFGIIIDNSIVMIEHMRQHGNRKIFLAILAATLTTLGSLSVIFLLSAEQQAQLGDFAAVVVINLALSLLVAWFLIPSLLVKLRMEKQKQVVFSSRKRLKIKTGLAYFRCITFVRCYAWVMFILLVIGFGIPMHLLPTKMDGDGKGGSGIQRNFGKPFLPAAHEEHHRKVTWRGFQVVFAICL